MAVAANLRGFRALFTGGDGAGLDDLLAELGHEALAEEILQRTDEAVLLADAVAVPVHDGVVSEPDRIDALHDAVKALADLLKGDLVTVLSLTVPDEAAGDND